MYSESDMEVFALIVQMKGEGKLYSDVDAALMNGQRGRLPDEINSIISTEQPELVQLKLAITFLDAELKEAREMIQQDKGEIAQLEKRLAEANAEIKQLNREIGRLEANIKPPTS